MDTKFSRLWRSRAREKCGAHICPKADKCQCALWAENMLWQEAFPDDDYEPALIDLVPPHVARAIEQAESRKYATGEYDIL